MWDYKVLTTVPELIVINVSSNATPWFCTVFVNTILDSMYSLWQRGTSTLSFGLIGNT